MRRHDRKEPDAMSFFGNHISPWRADGINDPYSGIEFSPIKLLWIAIVACFDTYIRNPIIRFCNHACITSPRKHGYPRSWQEERALRGYTKTARTYLLFNLRARKGRRKDKQINTPSP